MNERMNKKELIELINSLGIDREDFYVISSGQLVLRGLLADAGDLDFAVSPKGLMKLRQKFNLVPKGDNWFTVNDKSECVLKEDFDNLNYKPQLCGDIYVQNIKEYYEYLLSSEREKDKKRISIVKKYIEENEKSK